MNPENQYQPPPAGTVQNMPPNQSFSSGQPPAAPTNYTQPKAPMSAQRKRKTPWILITLLVVFGLAFFGAAGFAIKVNSELADYKANHDKKTAEAVAANAEQVKKTEEQRYMELAKDPHLKYAGPDVYGSIKFEYPKTWSAMVDTGGSGSTPVNGYFHTGIIPGPKSETAFALRLEVLQQPYEKVLATYDSSAKKGAVRVSPYKAELVPSVLGARVDGEIVRGIKQGSAVLFPIRDKTIRVSTLSGESYGKDFDEVILKTLDFTP